MQAEEGSVRALLVRRGSPPGTSVVQLPHRAPSDGEVLVRLRAAALTPTDVLLCTGAPPPPLGAPAPAPFVPGLFFCGDVVSLGPFVEGLSAGEPVIGLVDGAQLVAAGGNDAERAADAQGAHDAEEAGAHSVGGSCRELVRAHFSSLLPAGDLAGAGLHMPSVVAHVPPMVGALFCACSHLRLRRDDALLVVAPRVADVIFLLQRLILLADAWAGPLYLLVLQGRQPSRAELERHPLLRPMLAQGTDAEGPVGSAAAPPARTFLDDFVGLSADDHAQQRFGPGASPRQIAEALRELVDRVHAGTGGAGLDVILALDVDLAPGGPASGEETAEGAAGDGQDGAAAEEERRPATLLRTLVGALAIRGRLVTTCRNLEMTPADSEHLWANEGTVSFLNPHCALLSSARHGAMIHAMVEVAGRILGSELPVAESEVAQFRLFEQFQHALEACGQRGARGALLAVLVP